MKSLIITKPYNNKLNPNVFNLVNCATQIGATVDVLVLGKTVTTIAVEIAQINKVTCVYTIESPNLENILAENIAKQLSDISSTYTHVIMAADSFGKDVLPRIAGILELGQISEITQVISPNIFKKLIYTGNILIEIESIESIKLLTVRTTNFAAASISSEYTSTIINIPYINDIHPKVKFINNTIKDSRDLANAKIVVSGGRSLGSKDNFAQYIEPLAQKLHAAIGATRAAVDAGYAPNDYQVGQTGKVIAPNIYLAIGISGAIQHIAGIKDSKIILAINIDPTAAIFEYADYGLVGDLFDIIPALIEKI